MLVEARIFGNNSIEICLEILADGGIGIFVDGQTGARMHDMNMGYTRLDLAHFGELPLNLAGDKMEAAAFGRDGYLFLEYLHQFLKVNIINQHPINTF